MDEQQIRRLERIVKERQIMVDNVAHALACAHKNCVGLDLTNAKSVIHPILTERELSLGLATAELEAAKGVG